MIGFKLTFAAWLAFTGAITDTDVEQAERDYALVSPAAPRTALDKCYFISEDC